MLVELWKDLIMAFQHLKEASKKEKRNFLAWAVSDRTRGTAEL